MDAPLAGIRIVDLTHFVAGPWCTMMLADLGAQVTKVEPIGTGEIGRTMGAVFTGGESALFLGFNRNKRSVALNLKTDQGREIATRMVADADVIVHNFRPGAAERIGLGPAQLLPRFPRLIYCAISAFGASGPYAAQPANDPIIQALAGAMLPETGPLTSPVRLGVSLPDFAAGIVAAVGILAAVLRRNNTGAGGLIETNLLEAQLFAQTDRLQEALLHQAGRWPAGEAPSPSTFRCSDGDYLYVDIQTAEQATRAAEVLGISIRAGGRTLGKVIADRIATLPLDEARTILDGAGIASARIVSLTEGFAAATHLVRQLTHPQVGALSVLATPIDSSPPWTERIQPQPGLGAHTREVLREHGVTDTVIDDLVASGIAQCGPTIVSDSASGPCPLAPPN